MNIALIVFTDGRHEYLSRTLESAKDKINCEFKYKTVYNDDPTISIAFPCEYGCTTINNLERHGYCAQIRKAWLDLPEDTDYVFHLEDDFEFNERIPVMDMIEVLEAHPNLAQMALVRQPVNDVELKAGNIIDAHAEWYTQRNWGKYEWWETNFSFTNNPCIYPKRITEFGYPEPPHGEGKFSALLRDKGYYFGFWGNKRQMVTHIGEYRASGGFY